MEEGGGGGGIYLGEYILQVPMLKVPSYNLEYSCKVVQ